MTTVSWHQRCADFVEIRPISAQKKVKAPLRLQTPFEGGQKWVYEVLYIEISSPSNMMDSRGGIKHPNPKQGWLPMKQASISIKQAKSAPGAKNRSWGVGRAAREKQAASRLIPTRSGPVRSQSGSVAEHTANECAV